MGKTTLLKSMLLLCALVVGSNSLWAANYVLNGSNFDNINGGSGYAAYDGNHNIGGITITSSDVMTSSGNLQIKKTSGYLYNKTAMPGDITNITLSNTTNLAIYVGTEMNPSTTTVTSGSTISGSYRYFKVKSTGGAAATTTITVTYSSTYTVTYDANGADEGTAPTDPKKYADDATVTVLGNTGSLAKDHYSFGGWNTKADGSGTTYAGGATFQISDNTTLYAKWNGNPHDITMPAADAFGTYTASATDDVPYGTEVTLTYTPASGYETYVATWYVNGALISGNTFDMPDEDVTITVTAALPPDYVILPFAWDGGTSSELAGLTGVTTSGLGSDYAAGNAPYRVKMDGAGEYIQIKTNAQPGKVCIGVKMIGGATTSKIKVQESSDGSEFTDVEELEISGSQNDVLELETSKAFKEESRYVRIIKSVHASGGNIGVGPISIYLGLSDAADYTPTAMNDVNVTLNRSFVAGWNGIVLPFDLTNDVKTALGVSDVKTLSSASGDASSVTLTFADASLPVAAGTPILVKLAAAASNVSFEGVDLKTSAITPVAETAGGSTFTLTGTYASTYLDSEEVYLVSNTKFYHKKAGDALTASPFRAYIVQTGDIPAHIGFDLEDGGTTGIVEINAIRNTMSESIYNVAGQRVAQPTKGLYIVNGKKVVLK